VAPRGVHQPALIDLITPDPSSGEVVLVMLEERPWERRAGAAAQLEAKFNAYLEYALGGHLAEQLPEYAERPVRFPAAKCAENPRPADGAFFTAMANFARRGEHRLRGHGEASRWAGNDEIKSGRKLAPHQGGPITHGSPAIAQFLGRQLLISSQG